MTSYQTIHCYHAHLLLRFITVSSDATLKTLCSTSLNNLWQKLCFQFTFTANAVLIQSIFAVLLPFEVTLFLKVWKWSFTCILKEFFSRTNEKLMNSWKTLVQSLEKAKTNCYWSKGSFHCCYWARKVSVPSSLVIVCIILPTWVIFNLNGNETLVLIDRGSGAWSVLDELLLSFGMLMCTCVCVLFKCYLCALQTFRV